MNSTAPEKPEEPPVFVRQMCSFPAPLYAFGKQQAQEIARQSGGRASFSAYISSLLVIAKETCEAEEAEEEASCL